MLGPFDYYYTPPGQQQQGPGKKKEDDDMEEDKRYLEMNWQKRRSGAEFRGEVN